MNIRDKFSNSLALFVSRSICISNTLCWPISMDVEMHIMEETLPPCMQLLWVLACFCCADQGDGGSLCGVPQSPIRILSPSVHSATWGGRAEAAGRWVSSMDPSVIVHRSGAKQHKKLLQPNYAPSSLFMGAVPWLKPENVAFGVCIQVDYSYQATEKKQHSHQPCKFPCPTLALKDHV